VALFFDVDWFEARLAERGLSRAVLAAVSGLSGEAVDLIFKDQRELSAAEVAVFAELLGASPAEIAERAGVSTPVPAASGGDDRLAAIEARLARIEALLEQLARR
jgi:hypothetical protein